MTATDHDTAMIGQHDGEEQAAILRRLDDVWAAAAARDFSRLESFHSYDPRFTAFKDGTRRMDAAANAAGERALFSMLDDLHVEMRDLAVHVFGDAAVVTFNGHFGGRIHDSEVVQAQQATLVFVKDAGDWKIAHEHFSPLAAE